MLRFPGLRGWIKYDEAVGAANEDGDIPELGKAARKKETTGTLVFERIWNG